MTTADVITHLDQITTEWLTSVLTQSGDVSIPFRAPYPFGHLTLSGTGKLNAAPVRFLASNCSCFQAGKIV
jgi:hypothetical protein